MIMNPPFPPHPPHAHPPKSSKKMMILNPHVLLSSPLPHAHPPKSTKKKMIMNPHVLLSPPLPYAHPPKSTKKKIVIREVWADNLEFEFQLIKSLLCYYPFASMDTEFPGVVYPGSNVDKKLLSHLQPYEHYHILKTNVDNLNIIQVGLTLSNANGDLPVDPSTDTCFIWEFNFSDFDVTRDSHAPDSIELLKKQGIDFVKNREKGINSAKFAEQLALSGLVGGNSGCNWVYNSSVTWITFHSAYDFGYLIKILTGRKLPNQLSEFMSYVYGIFGPRVYDIKHIMKYCESLYGGLDRVAKTLHIDRAVGMCHQAGSDSLLTLHTFFKIKEKYFGGQEYYTEKYSGVLFGLEVY